MLETLLSVQGLRKSYDGFVLEDLDLDLRAGEVLGLVGSNGAGKTTLIKSVLGLIRPDKGAVSLLGTDLLSATDAQLKQAKQQMGVVFDTCSLPSEYTVAQAGRFMAGVFDAWDAKRFRALCVEFGLAADKKVKELSRGMGMKLSLAVAFCHGARLLILDEATAGLDPLAREEMLDILRDFMVQSEAGVLLATHITSDLEGFADRVICLDAGRKVFEVSAEHIAEEAAVAHCTDAQLAELEASDFAAPGTLRIIRNPYSTDVLVEDRADFARRFPQMVVDRCTIEDYMRMMMKGGLR